MLEEQVGSGRHTVSIWVFACSQLRGDQMLSLIFVSQSDTEMDLLLHQFMYQDSKNHIVL